MSSPASAIDAPMKSSISELVAAGSLEISPRELHKLGGDSGDLRGSGVRGLARGGIGRHGAHGGQPLLREIT